MYRPFSPWKTDLTEDGAQLKQVRVQQIRSCSCGGGCGVGGERGGRGRRLDNNARTGYRETVAAKPRSGSRRCLN